jgi:uncharacterized membrane protein
LRSPIASKDHPIASEGRMTAYTIYFAAFLIGLIAGLRTFTPLAAVSWGAFLGGLGLGGTRLAFLGTPVAPWILTAAAIAELVADQLPSTPSRKTRLQFAARILSGALCGGALAVGTGTGAWRTAATAGVLGAGLGTVCGAAVRRTLAQAFRQDRPAAVLEDAVAIVGAILVVGLLG